MLDTLVIPTWANGPDHSGNGGWSAALLARHVRGGEAGVEVSLRVPPPLGRELLVAEGDGRSVLLLDDAGDGEPVVVATAAPAAVDVAVPEAVRTLRPDAAAAASAGFPFRKRHPFPRCVSCGIDREPGQPSLGIHCGPVAGVRVADEAGRLVDVYADAWTPTPELADGADPALASVEACWSALDCPSAAPFADPGATHPSVLARIAVRLERQASIGAPHVLASWERSVDGRKQHSVSVLLDAHGEVLAVAQALWIQVRRP